MWLGCVHYSEANVFSCMYVRKQTGNISRSSKNCGNQDHRISHLLTYQLQAGDFFKCIYNSTLFYSTFRTICSSFFTSKNSLFFPKHLVATHLTLYSLFLLTWLKLQPLRFTQILCSKNLGCPLITFLGLCRFCNDCDCLGNISGTVLMPQPLSDPSKVTKISEI